MRYVRLATWMVSVAVTLIACGSDPAPDQDDIELPIRRPLSDADIEASEGSSGEYGGIVDAGPDAAFVATANAALCAAPSLVLCFTFEGVVVDKSANGLAPDTANVTFTPGHVGQAAAMGAASYIHFAAAAPFEVTTATIEAWANTTAGGVIFDDDSRMSLTILPDGTVQCVPDLALPTAKIPLGTWAHVACVFDGQTTHVYVNGVEADTGPSGPIASSPASTAALGGNAPSGEPFSGGLDSVRVFSVARTAADILAAAH